jgi:hypothetical protein
MAKKLCIVLLASLYVMQCCAFLTIKDGYFWDPDTQSHFIPRGISYQTFNQDIGQWITYAQIDYDMRQMKLANINSLRVDFAWRDIENDGEGVFQWDRFDFLINMCETNNIKIFPLIGYQWPPDWFPGIGGQEIVGNVTSGWFSMHPPGPAPGQVVTPETKIYKTYWTSDIMSFTHPIGLQKYANFMAAVANRYKNSPAVAAWIVGNEYGFLGLWSFRFDGYEPTSQAEFRTYLKNLYNNDISKLNTNWNSQLTSFDEVTMPIIYNRDDPSWADLIQWRKEGVANYIATGAVAVRNADPNHMISYSMVGMIFGGVDWMYECEDNMKIVAACKAAGAPLDFWSINSYPSTYPGNELRTGTYGIEFAQRTGIPVMYTETGASSTDAGFDGFANPDERQGRLLRNFAWEAYMNGVIGVHIFTLNDRDYITDREYGFGIVKTYREKKASYAYITDLFYQIALIEQTFPALFTSLHYAAYDVAFYWPSYTIDQMYCRFQNNLAGVWGPLTRLGLRSRFMNETQLLAGEYKNVQVLVLPRNQRMLPGILQFIYDHVIPSGVNVYAEADLPGYQDYYIRNQSDFMPLMESIFGIQPVVINAFEDIVTVYDISPSPYTTVELQPTLNMGYMYAYQSTWFGVWKYHKVLTTSGQTIVNMLLQRENNLLEPGIIMKNHGKAKSIIAAFSLGDTVCDALQCWTGHYTYYSGLFLSPQGLNMTPAITITGSAMVQTQIMNTENNMKVLYVTNWDDYSTTYGIQLVIPEIVGMTVKDLLDNRNLITASSDGVITLDMTPNDLRIFLIGEPIQPAVHFIYNQTVVDIFPTTTGSPIAVQFDTASSQSSCILRVRLLAQNSRSIYAQAATRVSGRGWTQTNMSIVDYSTINTQYLSSDEGAGNTNYYYEAALSCPGYSTVTTTLNVLLSWPVAPKQVATSVTANTPVATTISWENLPISRLNAFQGVVGIWNSTKTGSIDPSHYDKVAAVAATLESIGYVLTRMIAWDQGLQDYGPLYHIFNDSIPSDPTGMGSLSVHYFGEYVKYLILPGVTVLSDSEAANLRTWVTHPNFTDITLISTEGGVGRLDENGNPGEHRLADLFGVSSTLTSTSANVQVKITDPNHPITYLVAGNTFSSVAPAAYVNVTTGIAHGTINDGTNTYPAIITNQISDWSKAMTFNFDITNVGTYQAKQLWNSFSTWMHCNALIYKMTWRALCKNATIATNDTFIITGTGTQIVSVTPNETCSGLDLVWEGYLYYWNVTEPLSKDNNLGYYTSANDYLIFKNAAVSKPISLLLLVIALCLML